ncbi:MAG: asparagine synthase-related protein [Candidatus Acidiferrales bacterium]
MSAIVGIFDRNGAPVERPLLRAFTQFLAYCGPDGPDIWNDGPIGFGNAMLRTTRESLAERQPASLDGRLWITADARLDCREELKAEPGDTERHDSLSPTDSDLILQAYAKWGPDCVQHLRGDFVFAIWDRRRKILFCARDRFGVKPFYYADLDGVFVFSSVLNCVRLHPDVSEDLNETAIGDFLLFGLNCDTATTTFRDVRRLPPAHTLTVTAEEFHLKRYWSPPTDGRIRYRHADDYIEHFKVLLQAAVKDRLRAERVGILLSGGLDSGAVATTARTLSKEAGEQVDLRAYTVVYESLIPDRDGAYAKETAEFLKIPIRYVAMDGLQPFDRWNGSDWTWPEPTEDPFAAGLFDQFQMISEDCRAVLSGEGSDNLMHFEMWPHAKDLAWSGHWAQLFAESLQYASRRRSPWPGVRRRIKGLFGEDGTAPRFPGWIAPDFARRVSLEDRWKETNNLFASGKHPILPQAHASLSLPNWTYMFEHENPGVTRFPTEVRYPFLDLRIVNYLLALPPFPWFFEKALLREAMVGRLPENVRRRPKSPLAGDPLAVWLGRSGSRWMTEAEWSGEVDNYINRRAIPELQGGRQSGELSSVVRPLCLNFWLQSVRRVRYNLGVEARNG